MSPIRPENRDRYPDNWPEISRRIREDRAQGQCECDGRCEGRSCAAPRGVTLVKRRCQAHNGQPHPITGSRVVLTVAHLDHTPENCQPSNLLAMCQACHLAYDADHHAETRAAVRAAEVAALYEAPLVDADVTASGLSIGEGRTG